MRPNRVTSPVLTGNTTSRSQNGSCTVSLRCTSASGSKVSYNWTVREQTFSGSSSLQYPIRPEDGDVQFTCTVWNMVSEQSASITVKCSNSTPDQQVTGLDRLHQPIRMNHSSKCTPLFSTSFTLILFLVNIDEKKKRSTDRVTSPSLTENTTSHSQNGSCTVSLGCTSASGSKVSYNWTVGEQTFSGSSSLQYPIRPEDGDVQFTCTVWNMVSEQSASITVKCSNTSNQPNTGNNANDLTVYADISDVVAEVNF
ncbi:hypothetical protein INR49_017237 [Caranx melampygus]|nr:hypothetical protein INR49_017237 [Caranx melampygus]